MEVSDLRTKLILIPWHPLYTVCQGLVFGIALQANITLALSLLPVGLLLHLLFSQLNYQTAALIFIASLGTGSYQSVRIENNFNQAALAAQKTALNITGKIIEIEQFDAKRIRITLKILSAKNSKKNSSLLSGWYIKVIQPKKPSLSFQISDSIKYKKIYITTPAEKNSYKQYLLQNRCLGITRTKESAIHIYRPKWSFRRWICTLKTKIIDAIHAHTNTETAALIETIFLGKKNNNAPINKKYRQLFQNWGISHYLARSGLHLSMIALILQYAAYICIPHFGVRILFLLITALFYTLISWTSTSYLRALMFLLFILFAILQRRPVHTLVIFTFVTCITLLYTPHLLFALDFQLSFLISGMLIWRNHVKFFQSLA